MPPTTLPAKAMPLMVPFFSMENQLLTSTPEGMVEISAMPRPQTKLLAQRVSMVLDIPRRAKPPHMRMVPTVMVIFMPNFAMSLPTKRPANILAKVLTSEISCTCVALMPRSAIMAGLIIVKVLTVMPTVAAIIIKQAMIIT